MLQGIHQVLAKSWKIFGVVLKNLLRKLQYQRDHPALEARYQLSKKNHSMICVRKDLKDNLVPAPVP